MVNGMVTLRANAGKAAPKSSFKANATESIVCDDVQSSDGPSPVYFPSPLSLGNENSVANNTSASHQEGVASEYRQTSSEKVDTFQKACLEAIKLRVPLVLTCDVKIFETIILRGQDRLTIVGRGRPKIQGDLHSLFLLNNKTHLYIKDIDLDHSLCVEDHKNVGAAINIRSKAGVSIEDSRIDSASGFCVWAVQKTSVKLLKCQLQAPTRSAMVCFGQAKCQLEKCHIDKAGVHGLCARGTCHIEMKDCQITHSTARAIYVYAGASLDLDSCRISDTIHPEKAAVEASCSHIKDMDARGSAISRCMLRIRNCVIVENLGIGIRVRGPILHSIEESNIIEQNKKGDTDILDIIEHEDDLSVLSNASCQGLPPFLRGKSSSSFRRGDWLCSHCFGINAAKQSQSELCIYCKQQKSVASHMLTDEEIRECNKGNDIRTKFLISSKQRKGESSHTCGEKTVWEFDGDEKGWIPYDKVSSDILEETYQLHLSQDSKSKSSDHGQSQISSKIHILEDRYTVNLITMQQENNETRFVRLVQRRVTS